MAELERMADHAEALERCGDLFRSDPIGSNMVASALSPTIDASILRASDGASTLGVALATAGAVTTTRLGAGASEVIGAALPLDGVVVVQGPAGDAAALAGHLVDRSAGTMSGPTLLRTLRVSTAQEQSKRRRGRAFETGRDRLDEANRWALARAADSGLLVPVGTPVSTQPSSQPSTQPSSLPSTQPSTMNMGAAINEHRLIEWRSKGDVVAQLVLSAARFGVVRISELYVPPEFRSQGHAASFLAEIIRQQLGRQKVDDVILTMEAGDSATNRLFRRLGFVGHHELLVIRMVPGPPANS